MTDGRVYTLEDEIDVIHEDLGRARRHRDDMLRAHSEGRIADQAEHDKHLHIAELRIRALEAALREACAQQVAAEEMGRP